MDTVNVITSDFRKIVRRNISIIPGAWVEFYDDVTVGSLIESLDDTRKDSILLRIDLLFSQISDWNFADEKGEKLPVTKESFKRLSNKILECMIKEQYEVLSYAADLDKKKDSVGV